MHPSDLPDNIRDQWFELIDLDDSYQDQYDRIQGKICDLEELLKDAKKDCERMENKLKEFEKKHGITYDTQRKD